MKILLSTFALVLTISGCGESSDSAALSDNSDSAAQGSSAGFIAIPADKTAAAKFSYNFKYETGTDGKIRGIWNSKVIEGLGGEYQDRSNVVLFGEKHGNTLMLTDASLEGDLAKPLANPNVLIFLENGQVESLHYENFQATVSDKPQDKLVTIVGRFGRDETDNRTMKFRLMIDLGRAAPNGSYSHELDGGEGVIVLGDSNLLSEDLVSVRKGDVTLIDVFMRDLQTNKIEAKKSVAIKLEGRKVTELVVDGKKMNVNPEQSVR